MSKVASHSAKAVINTTMTVREIIALFPLAADIMMEYGLHCFACSLGGMETLREGALLHQLTDETLEALVDDINDAITEAPERPWTLTVTVEAARGILEIAKKEGQLGYGLTVIVDENGGFCLEFQEERGEWDQEFSCTEEPDVKVYASPITLTRIGGATIDYREGRFKLDLLEDGCCQKKEEKCACSHPKIDK